MQEKRKVSVNFFMQEERVLSSSGTTAASPVSAGMPLPARSERCTAGLAQPGFQMVAFAARSGQESAARAAAVLVCLEPS